MAGISNILTITKVWMPKVFWWLSCISTHLKSVMTWKSCLKIWNWVKKFWWQPCRRVLFDWMFNAQMDEFLGNKGWRVKYVFLFPKSIRHPEKFLIVIYLFFLRNFDFMVHRFHNVCVDKHLQKPFKCKN